jgi:hypothetical protein
MGTASAAGHVVSKGNLVLSLEDRVISKDKPLVFNDITEKASGRMGLILYFQQLLDTFLKF